MSRIVIVPMHLHREIMDRLEAACHPDITRDNFDELYHGLLAYYDEHGRLPDFRVEKKA